MKSTNRTFHKRTRKEKQKTAKSCRSKFYSFKARRKKRYSRVDMFKSCEILEEDLLVIVKEFGGLI